MSDVYLIHLDDKIGGHAQHYIGWAEDVETRLQDHADTTWEPPTEPGTTGTTHGAGTPLLAAANYYHIQWHLARVFPGQDRRFERQLKNCKNAARYCPMCRPQPREYKPKG